MSPLDDFDHFGSSEYDNTHHRPSVTTTRVTTDPAGHDAATGIRVIGPRIDLRAGDGHMHDEMPSIPPPKADQAAVPVADEFRSNKAKPNMVHVVHSYNWLPEGKEDPAFDEQREALEFDTLVWHIQKRLKVPVRIELSEDKSMRWIMVPEELCAGVRTNISNLMRNGGLQDLAFERQMRMLEED